MQLTNCHVVLNLFSFMAIVLVPVCLVLSSMVRELSRAASMDEGSGYATFSLLGVVRLLALTAALAGLIASLCIPFG